MHSQNDWVLVLDDVVNEFQTPSPESNNDTTFPSPTILFHTLNGETKTLEESLTNALKLKEAQVIFVETASYFRLSIPSTPASTTSQFVLLLEHAYV